MLSLWRRTPGIASTASRCVRMMGDDGHIKDDKKGAFAAREKSLEEQYIRKREAEELAALRKELKKLKKDVEELKKKDD